MDAPFPAYGKLYRLNRTWVATEILERPVSRVDKKLGIRTDGRWALARKAGL